MRTYKGDAGQKSLVNNFEFEDEAFARVVNEKKVVQVGEWLFKIQPRDERVLVVHQNNTTDYESFENGITVTGSVVEFSTNDDVLHLLSNCTVIQDSRDYVIFEQEALATARSIFCSDKRAIVQNRSLYQSYVGAFGIHYEMYSRVAYQAYGIYFTLLLSAEHNRLPAGVATAAMDYGFNQIYIKRCDGKREVRNSRLINWTGTTTVTTSKIQKRCYEGTSALRNYFLEAEFLINGHRMRHAKALSTHIEDMN